MRFVVAILVSIGLSSTFAAGDNSGKSTTWENSRGETRDAEVLPEAGDFEGLDKDYSRQRTQNYSSRERKSRDFDLYDPRFDDGKESSSGH